MPKMISLYDTFFGGLDIWLGQPRNNWSKLTKYGRDIVNKVYDLHYSMYRRSTNKSEVVLPIKDARAFLKVLRAVKKDVGKYGGVPAHIKTDNEALSDAIEELQYAIKNPES